MPSWYLGKIKYQQEQENGSLKQISESYLIDAVSYTDAEARLYAVVADNTPDFSIASLGPMKLSDVFEFKDDDGQLDGETYFKVKMYYESIDDTKSNPVVKKIASTMLVNAHSPKEAIERIEKSLATMLIPYFITDVNTTAILEVHPYVAEEKDAPEGFRPLSEVMGTEENPNVIVVSVPYCPFKYCDSNPPCEGKCRHSDVTADERIARGEDGWG